MTQQSEHLIALCDEFISNQRGYFDTLLKRSNGTLAYFKESLEISAGLLLALMAALAYWFIVA